MKPKPIRINIWLLLLLLILGHLFPGDGPYNLAIVETLVIALVMAAVTIVLSELLRPKPKFENARPPGLGDFQFPTAIEGRPVPIIFGRVQIAGPNVVWYGDLKTKKVEEKIKTGLWSSKTITTGFEYEVGIQFGLCRGPIDGIRRIWVGDSIAYDGAAVSDGPITIDKPKIFGGKKFGAGGLKGTLRIHPGNETQGTNTYLTAHQNPITPHRGTCYCVWERGYIGNSTTLKPWKFEVERFPNGLGLTGGKHIVNSADANPAAVIYELLTDTDWGFGFPGGDVDATDLRAAGDVLFTEGSGFSMIIDRNMEAADLLQELERQIDGIVFLDQLTGKFKIKLSRADYVIGSVPQLSATTNVKEVREFTRGTWEETANQVMIGFADRSRDYFRTFAKADDLANQRIQAGEVIPITKEFPGVKDKTLATQIASRELRLLSIPLAKATLAVDRSLYTLKPGDVVAWTDVNLGFTQLPMRVARINFGELRDGTIVLLLVQDTFLFSAGYYPAPEATRWTAPVQDVTGIPAADQRIIEAPRAITQRDPKYPGTGDRIWAGGRRQTGSEVAFRIWQRNAVGTPSGAFAEDSDDAFRFLLVGTLKDALTAGDAAGTVTIGLEAGPDTLADLHAAFQSGAAAVDIGQNLVNLILVDNEFMAVSSSINQGTHLDLTGVWRGMLDTVPAVHADATKVYLVAVGGELNDSAIAAGRTVHGQIRPSSRTDEATEGESTTVTVVMDNRVRRPYPPTQLKLNTALYPATPNADTLKGGGSTLDDRGLEISYVRRDFRTFDETQGITTDAGSIDATYPSEHTTQHLTEIVETGTSLLTGLSAAWNLNEASGTRQDATAADIDLSDINTVGSDAGKIGTAANFIAANNEALEAASASSLNFGDVDFTLCAWVRMTSKAAVRVIMGKADPSTNNRQYNLFYDNVADRFRFTISTDGTAVSGINADKFGSPSTNTWYLVVAWHDATANRIYIRVNHGLIDSAAHTGGAFSSSGAKFRIGAQAGSSPLSMQGMIDAAAVWSRVLKESEMALLYNTDVGQEHPYATRRTVYSSGWISGNLPHASRTKIVRNTGGSLPTTTLEVRLKSRHTVESVVRESMQTLLHPFSLAASTLDDDTSLGILNESTDSNPYVAPTTGSYVFTLGTALSTGAVRARLNGGAYVDVIAAGTTSGTLAGVTAGDVIEVRHTQAGADASETFLEVNAPSSSLDAYAIITF